MEHDDELMRELRW